VSVRRPIYVAVATAGLFLLGAVPAAACPEHSAEAESVLAQLFGAALGVVS
jgi:hypothetical protein